MAESLAETQPAPDVPGPEPLASERGGDGYTRIEVVPESMPSSSHRAGGKGEPAEASGLVSDSSRHRASETATVAALQHKMDGRVAPSAPVDMAASAAPRRSPRVADTAGNPGSPATRQASTPEAAGEPPQRSAAPSPGPIDTGVALTPPQPAFGGEPAAHSGRPRRMALSPESEPGPSRFRGVRMFAPPVFSTAVSLLADVPTSVAVAARDRGSDSVPPPSVGVSARDTSTAPAAAETAASQSLAPEFTRITPHSAERQTAERMHSTPPWSIDTDDLIEAFDERLEEAARDLGILMDG